MCGIVAYIGSQKAYPIILKGLKRLEYRGYDSSGIALFGHVQLIGRILWCRSGWSHYLCLIL